ncbi:MAG: Ig-like domain-containing surface protein [bacterium P3]|nr:MAG: Ig-like domain-containing surface protein [bacterium P3]KWW40099.1 MAG: Ig-like domain-containing surface protein [bacterium F083]
MKKSNFFVVLALISLFVSTNVSAHNHSEQAPSGQMLYYSVTTEAAANTYTRGAIVTHPGTGTAINTNTHIWGSNALPTGALVIPDSVHYRGVAYPVIGISQYTFMQCDGLTSVTLPGTLKNIGQMAFYGCDSLESVTVPSTVTWASITSSNWYFGTGIESWTFANCPRLTGDFTIPNGVTYIEERAFSNTAITSVSFPSSLTYIGKYAFYHSALTSLSLPSSLTTIDGMAFGWCDRLTGIITLPESLTAIVGGAFLNCYKVLSINIPSTTNIYSFEDNSSYDIQTFFGVNNINYPRNINVENWSINDGWVLGAKTFNGYIEDGLVYRNQSKTKVTGCDYQLSSFTVPAAVDTVGLQAFYSSDLTNISLPEGLEVISGRAFKKCEGLTDINIPSTVASIGDEAFAVTGIADITLPASLSYLGFGVFDNLDTLRMLGSMPPIIDTVYYYDSSLVNTPIVVPCNAGSAYRHAAGWSMCNNTIDPCVDEVVYFTVSVSSADPTMGTATINGSASATVEDGETATITATANEGYHFTHWNDGDTNAERTATITSDTTFIAYFETDAVMTSYTVTVVSADPEMGTVSAGGEVEEGESFTFRAIANYGYHFVQWSDGDTANPRTVTVTADAAYMALFEADQSDAPQITYVGVDSNGHNSVYWTAQSGNGISSYRVYREGTQAGVYEPVGTVRATGATAYSWSDDQSNPSVRAYSYRLSAERPDGSESAKSTVHSTIHLQISQGQGGTWNLAWTPYAGFAYSTYRIYRGTTAGNLSPLATLPSTATTYSDLNESAADYYQIEVVRLSPSKDGGVSSRSNIVTTDPEPQRYALTVLSADITRGTVSGGGSYTEGDTATLTATAREGYSFLQWQDGATANPREILVTAAATYMAYFAPTEGIADAESADGVSLEVRDGRLVVSGAEGRRVTLSDALGRILYRGTAAAPLTLTAPAAGVYLLQVEGSPARRVTVVK